MSAESYVQAGLIWSRTDAGWKPRKLGGERGAWSSHWGRSGAPRMSRMAPEASLKLWTFTSSFLELYINPHLLEIITLPIHSLKLHELREKSPSRVFLEVRGQRLWETWWLQPSALPCSMAFFQSQFLLVLWVPFRNSNNYSQATRNRSFVF